jgi:sulfur-oxidizing protein SoxZ
MRAKAKLKKGTVKVKAMFKSAMAGREEAEKKKMKPEFITHIIAKVNGTTVYEVSTGAFISKNPLFKFQFTLPEVKKGDKMAVTTTRNNGKSKTKKVKIK